MVGPGRRLDLAAGTQSGGFVRIWRNLIINSPPKSPRSFSTFPHGHFSLQRRIATGYMTANHHRVTAFIPPYGPASHFLPGSAPRV